MLFCTYNMHYGVGADGKYDVARVADAIAEADIVCLQEVVSGWAEAAYADQAAEIGGRLNRYFIFHGAMDADASTVDGDGRIVNRRRTFGNAVVSRWPIVWSRSVLLPKTRLAGVFDLQRGYIEAVVNAPGGPLRVYCTHLSHVGPRQRLPQVMALMEAINRAAQTGGAWDARAVATGEAEAASGAADAASLALFREPSAPVPASAIVAGDFNFTPAHPEYPQICGTAGATPAPLADTWIAAGNGAEEVDSFPSEGRIDHVFVTHDLVPRVKRAWIDRDVSASDHWPVFVEFAP